MKPKTLPVLEDCIEVGLKLGMNRVYKYAENPSEVMIMDEQHRAIMEEIFERFDFEELNDEQ
jgi:hypothetical protein